MPSIKYQLTLELSSWKYTTKRSKTLFLAISCREPCTDDHGTTSFWHSTLPIGNSTSFDIISYNISFSSTLVTYEVCGARPSLSLSLAWCVQCIFIRFVFGSKQKIPGPLTPFTRRRQDFAVWLLYEEGRWIWVRKKNEKLSRRVKNPRTSFVIHLDGAAVECYKAFRFRIYFYAAKLSPSLSQDRTIRSTAVSRASWILRGRAGPRSALVGCQPAGADVEVNNIWPRLGLPWENKFLTALTFLSRDSSTGLDSNVTSLIFFFFFGWGCNLLQGDLLLWTCEKVTWSFEIGWNLLFCTF